MKLIYFHVGKKLDGCVFIAGNAYRISDAKGSASHFIKRGFKEIDEKIAKEKKIAIFEDPRREKNKKEVKKKIEKEEVKKEEIKEEEIKEEEIKEEVKEEVKKDSKEKAKSKKGK